MGTLDGFPNPPAFWLRRAKPAFANATGSLRDRRRSQEQQQRPRKPVAGPCPDSLARERGRSRRSSTPPRRNPRPPARRAWLQL